MSLGLCTVRGRWFNIMCIVIARDNVIFKIRRQILLKLDKRGLPVDFSGAQTDFLGSGKKISRAPLAMPKGPRHLGAWDQDLGPFGALGSNSSSKDFNRQALHMKGLAFNKNLRLVLCKIICCNSKVYCNIL